MLAIFDIVVARSDWLWNSRTPNAVARMLEKERALEGLRPRIVCLGNSRMRDAIDAERMAAELGLDGGAVVNLALAGGQPFEAGLVHRRNRERLSQAELVIVNVDHFHGTWPHTFDARTNRFATLGERWRLASGRGQLVGTTLGWFWRTLDHRAALRARLSEWFVGPRIDPTLEVGEVRQDERALVDRIYGDGRRYAVHHEELQRLARAARADGAQVVFVHLPLRESFVDAAQAGRPAGLAARRRELASLANEVDLFVDLERAGELGLEPADFVDMFHVRPSGSAAITTTLADRIRPLLSGD